MSYSPTMMRWMEPDPLGVKYVNGPNLYQLEMANPINETDPTGCVAFKWPVNGVVVNESKETVVIWADDRGLRNLNPNEFDAVLV